MIRFAAIALLAACSPVRSHWVRPDYHAVDRTRTVRLSLVVVSADPADPPANLWALMARRYVNHHRDFVVVRHASAAVRPEACAEGLHGIMVLEMRGVRMDGEAEVRAAGALTRCSDGAAIWGASAGGAWPSDDDELAALTASYVEELGEGARPWAAPSMRLLGPLLDTLPRPHLVDDDLIMEKIELDD